MIFGQNLIYRYSDSAKTVARTLTRLGFKNSWIVGDGFSGGRGWLQSRLGTDSYKFSFAEVLSPSRIIPAGVKSFGTSSRQSSQKLLPGADWDFFYSHSTLNSLEYICALINEVLQIILIWLNLSFNLFHLCMVWVAPLAWVTIT